MLIQPCSLISPGVPSHLLNRTPLQAAQLRFEARTLSGSQSQVTDWAGLYSHWLLVLKALGTDLRPLAERQSHSPDPAGLHSKLWGLLH